VSFRAPFSGRRGPNHPRDAESQHEHPRTEPRKARANSALILPINRPAADPQFFVRKRIGVVLFDFGQQPRRFPAARDIQLPPRIAQALVDRVNRQAEFTRNRLRIVSGEEKPKRLLFPVGQRGDVTAHSATS